MADHHHDLAPRVPPHNIELEQALLGAIMINNDAFYRVSDFLDARHFFEPIHQKIFEAMTNLVRGGRVATPVTLKSFLPADINIGVLTTSQYLARLAAEATTVINAADYGQNIRDLAKLRDLIGFGEDMVNSAYQGDADVSVQDQIEEAERRLFELSAGSLRMTSAPAAAVVNSAVNRFTGIMTGKGEVHFLKTPFLDLNRRIGGGFRRGNLVVAAGRPGMGKTTMAACTAHLMASSGIEVLFNSLEMSDEEIGTRLLADRAWSHSSAISTDKILRGELTNGEAERLVLAAREFHNLPLTIDTAGYLTVAQIASRARARKLAMARRGQSLDLLVIDYLKFIRPTALYRGQRHYEIGEITAALKLLAKELDLCVLLLAQLNRDTEKRDDHRPRLSDLRESGDIEADADIVLFLFREAYYLQNDPRVATDAELRERLDQTQNTLEIIVAKNRMGPLGPVAVFCDPASSALRNAARPIESEAA